MLRKFIILIICVFMFGITSAQVPVVDGEDGLACEDINFIAGSPLRVIGSIEAGGIPYRNDPVLAVPAEGIIPLDSIVYSSEIVCSEGRVWVRISQVELPRQYQETGENERSIYGRWLILGDSYQQWLEPMGVCDIPSRRVHFPFWETGESISEMTYDSDSDSVILALRDDNRYRAHAATLSHIAIQLETGEVSEVDYPYAGIVTHELTDQLGITEYVFGERSRSHYSLYVSPDREHILYFVPQEQIEQCAHYCYPHAMYTANTDGSNAVYHGTPDPEMAIMQVVWGKDHFYLHHITESGGIEFTMRFCLNGEDNCVHPLSEWSQTFDLPENFQEFGVEGYVSESPDGRYVSVTPYYDYPRITLIFDTLTGNVIEIPDAVPMNTFWIGDNIVLFPFSGESDEEADFRFLRSREQGAIVLQIDEYGIRTEVVASSLPPRLRERFEGNIPVNARIWSDRENYQYSMFFAIQNEWLGNVNAVAIRNQDLIGLYCIPWGRG